MTSEAGRALSAIARDRVAMEQLRKLLGYVANDSARVVKISQDDATKRFIVTLGGGARGHFASGDTLHDAIADAFAQFGHEVE